MRAQLFIVKRIQWKGGEERQGYVPSEWGLEKLFTIINSRYENNLPVIITTNYNQNSLVERLSLNGEIETAKSIISRLYEMCYLVKIDDIDHRIKKKKVSNCGNND